MKQLHKIEGILVKERKCLLPRMKCYMPTVVFNIDSGKAELKKTKSCERKKGYHSKISLQIHRHFKIFYSFEILISLTQRK